MDMSHDVVPSALLLYRSCFEFVVFDAYVLLHLCEAHIGNVDTKATLGFC